MNKIGIILSIPPAYSETFLRSKIKGLISSGFDVTLFVQANTNNYDLSKIKVSPYAGRNVFRLILSMVYVVGAYLFYIKTLLNFINLEIKRSTSIARILKKCYLFQPILTADLDIIHFEFATMAIQKENIARSKGIKMTTSIRGYDINVFPLRHRNCYALLWDRVDKIHSISNDLLKKAYAQGLNQNVKTKIISPAVDVKNSSLMSSIDMNKDYLYIVTIARLTFIKNIDNLISCARLLAKQDVKFKWDIIGGGDQKEIERYAYHIYQKGLGDKVRLMGKKSHHETLTILNKSDIYVQTSYTEGFCNALLEAQSLGKLCVAYNNGALSENIEDGRSGWLIENNDYEQLADKIIELHALPVPKKEEIQKYTKDRIRSQFTIHKQHKLFDEFYRNWG